MRIAPFRCAVLVLLQAGLALATSAEPPPEDRCSGASRGRSSDPARDATPASVQEGALLGYDDILKLRSLIPVEVWRNRSAFFHEGMTLEVGACYRRYPVSLAHAEATTRFAGSAHLDAAGNLEDHAAGLPFPPETIDPDDERAGARWAWNLERRYRGAGPWGHFRIVDLPSGLGGVEVYEGSWSFVQLSHRADIGAEAGHSERVAPGMSWVSGGRFHEPLRARHLAWRQLRPLESARRYAVADDTFVYVPSLRKVRRAGATWVDGLYVPRFSATGGGSSGSVSLPSGAFGGAGGVQSSGSALGVTENLRRGFEGLSLRPNAYVWRVLGERPVLAPINVTRDGYPIDRNRNYGESGLSVGSDRWDLRWAVVIDGALRQGGRDYDLMTLYVDYQTQQPLYVITRRRGGQQVGVGVLLHRFSGDLLRYPTWPDGAKANVFDPVGAVFVETGGGGWRRESYDVTSIPRRPDEIARFASPGSLSRGR